MDAALKMRLVQSALEARKNAYVPYSGYRVGAAVATKEGSIYSGCNIENASYGLTNCAERTAIFKAVSQGERDFIGLAVAVDGSRPASPCGACRQVIREFFDDETEIFLVNENGQGICTTIARLLPDGFTKENMGGYGNS